jgi:broad specificity phosphatase PhoE
VRLLLIRHAESSANAEGRLQGHLDIPLSDRGRRESARLAERLTSFSIDALYASPLARAWETARIVAARVVLEPIERAALMERDVGELAGLTREEILARFPQYARDRAARRPVEVPGFERDEPFVARVLAAFDTIIASHSEERVAVVTHGGVIGAYIRHALELPTVRPGPLTIDNASITVFDVAANGSARMVSMNDTCHLNGLVKELPA